MNYCWRVSVGMGDILLLNSNTSGVCERITIKKMIISRGKNKRYFFTYLLLCTKQSCLAYTHLLLKLTPSILTAASPQYFPSCFPLVFLEGHYPILSSKEMLGISLHSDPTTWEASVLSKRVVSSVKTLF